MQANCMTEYTDKNVFISDTSPWPMGAISTVPSGYEENLCVKCTILQREDQHVYRKITVR